MSKTRKPLSILLIVLMVISLSACGAPAAPAATPSTSTEASAAPEATPTPEAPKEPVKLKLVTISTDEARQKIMDNYIKANAGAELPGIEIEYEGTGDLQSKIKVYNASGDLPDVWWSGADYAPGVINAGNQLNLESYITQDGFINKFKVKDGLYFRDGIYALGSGADTYFNPRIFYSKDIFAKNNIQVPTTFDEFVEVCSKLSAAGIQPISAPGKGGWAPAFFLIQNMIQIEDPDVVKDLLQNKTDFTNPVVKNALGRIETLAKAGAFGKGAANVDYGPAKEVFTQKKSAMYMMFSWEQPSLAEDPDVDFFPWPSAGPKYSPDAVLQYWGSPLAGYAVSAKSENIEEAVKLAEFCVMQDGLYFNDSGSIIALDVGKPGAELKPLQQKDMDHYNGTSTKLATVFLNAMDPKVATEFQNVGANLMTGDYTADQFINDFNKIWLENTWFD